MATTSQLENAGGSHKDRVQPKIKNNDKNDNKYFYLKKILFCSHILFLNLFNSVFLFSWSSRNFLLDILYFFHQIAFISSLLNGEWPCELHWEKF